MKVSDFLHLYYGQAIKYKRPDEDIYHLERIWAEQLGYRFTDMKLILRPWSDLKPEEVKAMSWDDYYIYWRKKKVVKGKEIIMYDKQQPHTLRSNEYLYLTSIGIDLFGLIDAGVALDKSTMPKEFLDVWRKEDLHRAEVIKSLDKLREKGLI